MIDGRTINDFSVFFFCAVTILIRYRFCVAPDIFSGANCLSTSSKKFARYGGSFVSTTITADAPNARTKVDAVLATISGGLLE